MSRWHLLFFVILIAASVAVTQFGVKEATSAPNMGVDEDRSRTIATTTASALLSFNETSLSDDQVSADEVPVRKWDVLDPEVSSDAVIIHSLEDNVPLFYYNSRDSHVLASLTKLLTSVVVIEEIGLDENIPISQKAVETRGLAGHLESGEVYSARDLLKLMLLVSSNDAAAAFEEYVGGVDGFVDIMKEKMDKIGMDSTVVYDASGLSDSNVGTGSDILKLTKYILKNHPKVFRWTRSYEMLVQPINSEESRKEYNINPLVDENNYLGGKTGTSKVAGENLVALFDIKDHRVAVILLGSKNRDEEALRLIDWVRRAYKFPNN